MVQLFRDQSRERGARAWLPVTRDLVMTLPMQYKEAFVNLADRSQAFQQPRSRSKNRASGSCTGSSWAADDLAIKRRSLSKASSNRTASDDGTSDGRI